ncbi:unnamed protein product [Triticum turgidum subsp. durum]|uniref:Piwi domain-containing protein n=1 Tax=Triticum turgidum subsp. durum TaxID=4567 RepID=A0A9R1BHM7_TRITD|nr:unnamed protein product [Triticum turgidum subsp. durum]
MHCYRVGRFAICWTLISTYVAMLAFRGPAGLLHYHVLWDEIKFTTDELETLTNNLCYTYAGCTRPVSIGKLPM